MSERIDTKSERETSPEARRMAALKSPPASSARAGRTAAAAAAGTPAGARRADTTAGEPMRETLYRRPDAASADAGAEPPSGDQHAEQPNSLIEGLRTVRDSILGIGEYADDMEERARANIDEAGEAVGRAVDATGDALTKTGAAVGATAEAAARKIGGKTAGAAAPAGDYRRRRESPPPGADADADADKENQDESQQQQAPAAARRRDIVAAEHGARSPYEPMQQQQQQQKQPQSQQHKIQDKEKQTQQSQKQPQKAQSPARRQPQQQQPQRQPQQQQQQPPLGVPDDDSTSPRVLRAQSPPAAAASAAAAADAGVGGARARQQQPQQQQAGMGGNRGMPQSMSQPQQQPQRQQQQPQRQQQPQQQQAKQQPPVSRQQQERFDERASERGAGAGAHGYVSSEEQEEQEEAETGWPQQQSRQPQQQQQFRQQQGQPQQQQQWRGDRERGDVSPGDVIHVARPSHAPAAGGGAADAAAAPAAAAGGRSRARDVLQDAGATASRVASAAQDAARTALARTQRLTGQVGSGVRDAAADVAAGVRGAVRGARSAVRGAMPSRSEVQGALGMLPFMGEPAEEVEGYNPLMHSLVDKYGLFDNNDCYHDLDGSGGLPPVLDTLADVGGGILHALPFSSLVFGPSVRRSGLFSSGGADATSAAPVGYDAWGQPVYAASAGSGGWSSGGWLGGAGGFVGDPLGTIGNGIGNVLSTVGGIVTAPLTPIAAGARALARGVGDAGQAIAETVSDITGFGTSWRGPNAGYGGYGGNGYATSPLAGSTGYSGITGSSDYDAGRGFMGPGGYYTFDPASGYNTYATGPGAVGSNYGSSSYSAGAGAVPGAFNYSGYSDPSALPFSEAERAALASGRAVDRGAGTYGNGSSSLSGGGYSGYSGGAYDRGYFSPQASPTAATGGFVSSLARDADFAAAAARRRADIVADEVASAVDNIVPGSRELPSLRDVKDEAHAVLDRAGRAAARGAGSAADAVARGGESVARGVENVARSAERGLERGADALARAGADTFARGADAAARSIDSAARAVESGVVRGADAAARGVNAAGRAVDDAAISAGASTGATTATGTAFGRSAPRMVASEPVTISAPRTQTTVAGAAPTGMHSHNYTVVTPPFATVTATGPGAAVAVTAATETKLSPTTAVPAVSEVGSLQQALDNRIRAARSPSPVSVTVRDNCATIDAVSDLQYARTEAATRAQLELEAARAAAARAETEGRARAAAQAEAQTLARAHADAQRRAAAEVEARLRAEVTLKTAAAAKAEAERLAQTQAQRRQAVAGEFEATRRQRAEIERELAEHRGHAERAGADLLRLQGARTSALEAAENHGRLRARLQEDMQRALREREAAEAAARAAADRAAADAEALDRLAREKQASFDGVTRRIEEHERRSTTLRSEVEGLGKLERDALAVAQRHAAIVEEQQKVLDASARREAAARREERGQGSRLAQLLAVLSSKASSESIARQEADAHRKAYEDAVRASRENEVRLQQAVGLDTPVTVIKDVGALPTVTTYQKDEPARLRLTKTTTTTTRTETDTATRSDERAETFPGGSDADRARFLQREAGEPRTRVEVLERTPRSETVRTTRTETETVPMVGSSNGGISEQEAASAGTGRWHVYDVRGLDSNQQRAFTQQQQQYAQVGDRSGAGFTSLTPAQQQDWEVRARTEAARARAAAASGSSSSSGSSGSGGGWFSWLWGSGSGSSARPQQQQQPMLGGSVMHPSEHIPEPRVPLLDRGTVALSPREIDELRRSGSIGLGGARMGAEHVLNERSRFENVRNAQLDAELERQMGVDPQSLQRARQQQQFSGGAGYGSAGFALGSGRGSSTARGGSAPVESTNYTTTRGWNDAGQMSAIERTRHSACIEHEHHGASAKLQDSAGAVDGPHGRNSRVFAPSQQQQQQQQGNFAADGTFIGRDGRTYGGGSAGAGAGGSDYATGINGSNAGAGTLFGSRGYSSSGVRAGGGGYGGSDSVSQRSDLAQSIAGSNRSSGITSGSGSSAAADVRDRTGATTTYRLEGVTLPSGRFIGRELEAVDMNQDGAREAERHRHQMMRGIGPQHWDATHGIDTQAGAPLTAADRAALGFRSDDPTAAAVLREARLAARERPDAEFDGRSFKDRVLDAAHNVKTYITGEDDDRPVDLRGGADSWQQQQQLQQQRDWQQQRQQNWQQQQQQLQQRWADGSWHDPRAARDAGTYAPQLSGGSSSSSSGDALATGPNMWLYRPLRSYAPGSGDVVMLADGTARYRDGTILRRDGALVRPDGVMLHADGSVARNRDGVVLTTNNFEREGRGRMDTTAAHPNFMLPSFFWMDDEKSVEYLDEHARELARKNREQQQQRPGGVTRASASVAFPFLALSRLFKRERAPAPVPIVTVTKAPSDSSDLEPLAARTSTSESDRGGSGRRGLTSGSSSDSDNGGSDRD